MPLVVKLITVFGLVVVAMGAGYLARRAALLPERAAKWIMTAVAAVGYPAVGFLSIWGMRLVASDALLPILGAVQCVAMMVLGLAAGRLVTGRRDERGLFAIASSLSNNGSTMGGFILFLLYGEAGLARGSIYCLMFFPVVVLLAYPVARHHAEGSAPMPLGRLYLRSIFDFRSMGLLTSTCAILLSAGRVPRPAFVAEWRVLDVLIFLLVPAAYFSIGLRLHGSQLRSAWKLIAASVPMRFGVGLGVGLALAAATHWTAWPLTGLNHTVFILQSFMPTAVVMVATANMFNLQPRTASVLFVSNTLLYLALVLPWVLGIFGR